MKQKSKISTPKVSIILPCFNVEKYLPLALDSALKQTLKDIEIIAIDDGSPDNCREILINYAKKDKRIKPIYQENKGYGGAVNAGIKKARGKYIAILEPDDYVSNTYYESLYNTAHRDNLDVCGVSSYCEIRDQVRPRLIQSWHSGKNELLSNSLINDYLASAMPGITLKIYRRNFIIANNIYFNESISAYLDIYFVTLVLLSRPKIKIIRGLGYYYRKGHIEQTTSNPNIFHNIIKLVDLTLNHALSINVGLKRKFLDREQRQALIGSLIAHLVSYLKKASVNKLEGLANTLSIKIKELLESQKSPVLNKHTYEFLNSKKIHVTPSKVVNCYISKISEFRNQDMGRHKFGAPSFSELLMEVEFFGMYTSMLDNKNSIQAATEKIVQFLIHFPGCYSNILVYFAKWFMLRYGVYTIEMMNRDSSIFVILNWYLCIHDDESHINLLAESATLFPRCKKVCNTIPELACRLPDHLKPAGSEMRLASIVWERLENNIRKFDKYIKGKTIAIVGNGPNEIGKKLGEEIDSHDIVVRFNNYSLTPEHAIDYGTKENIWVVTPGFDVIYFKNRLHQFEYIIFPMTSLFINRDRLRFLYNTSLAGTNILAIDTFHSRLSTDLIVPSVGLYFLLFISKRIHLTHKIKLYGFSSIEGLNENRHYFEGDPMKKEDIWPHEWSREKIFVDHIIQAFERKK